MPAPRRRLAKNQVYETLSRSAQPKKNTNVPFIHCSLHFIHVAPQLANQPEPKMLFEAIRAFLEAVVQTHSTDRSGVVEAAIARS